MASPGLKERAGARAQARALHRRVRDTGHRPHAEGCRLRFRAVRHRAFGLPATRRSRACCATSRRRSCRRSCGCPPRNTITSPAPPTWGRRASCCRWSARRGGARDPRLHEVRAARQARRGARRWRTTTTWPGPTMEKLAAANERTTLFAQIETRPGSRTPTRSPRSTASIASGSGISTSAARSASRASSSILKFAAAVKAVARACKKHGKALGRLVPDGRGGGPAARAGLRLRSATRATSGRCRRRCKAGIAEIRARTAGTGKGRAKSSQRSRRLRKRRNDGCGGRHVQVSRCPQRRLQEAGRQSGLSRLRSVAARARTRRSSTTYIQTNGVITGQGPRRASTR